MKLIYALGALLIKMMPAIMKIAPYKNDKVGCS